LRPAVRGIGGIRPEGGKEEKSWREIMKALLCETEYGKGFLLTGELSEMIKIIDLIKPARISNDIIEIYNKKFKFSIVDVQEQKESEAWTWKLLEYDIRRSVS
jgi:hypothetical protein